MITSLGGLWLYTIPSALSLTILYGFWGASTILLFWSSFVKAQRHLGLHTGQGKAFGLVDAGRGTLAAIMAISSVFLLEFFLGENADNAPLEDMNTAMQNIILTFAAITLICALVAYFFIEDDQAGNLFPHISLKGVKRVMQKPAIWMHSVIVMCAYVGYKCTDDFSLYASDTLNYNDIESAKLAAITFWARPLAAIFSGIIADRWLTSKTISVCFVIMIGGSLLISSGYLVNTSVFVLITLTITSVAIYGIRGIYYALFEETDVSLSITGSAAGLVSVVGYTPDVFMGPVMGVILDNNPGPLGHQYLFLLLAGFSCLGLIMAMSFSRFGTPNS